MSSCVFIMIRPPPRTTRTDTRFPYTTLFRSELGVKGSALSNMLSFDLSLYQIDWKKIQITLISASNGLAYTANAAKARIKGRSAEHTSELQSLMRISYAVFCLKKKTLKHN